MSHTEQSLKLVDKSEEEEDGATVTCEKERFLNELTLGAYFGLAVGC